MSSDDLLEALQVLNPRSLSRARRLACAVHLLRQGMSRKEACATIQLRFSVCQSNAWRVVDMAIDLAGPIADEAAGDAAGTGSDADPSASTGADLSR